MLAVTWTATAVATAHADDAVAPVDVPVAAVEVAAAAEPSPAQAAEPLVEPQPAVVSLPAVVEPLAPQPVPQNRAPRAADDRIVVAQGRSGSVDVFANDSDPDGDALSLEGGTSAGHGTLSFAGGVVTFTPDADFVGEDSFLYVVGDGRGATAAGTVRVTVTRAAAVQPPGPKQWNGQPTPPEPAPAPVEVTREAPPAVRPAAVRTAVTAVQPRRAVTVEAPAVAAPRTAPVAAPMGPSTTPYVAPAARPATLPFTGGPTDVLLPLGLGLVLAGGALTAGGRRRA